MSVELDTNMIPEIRTQYGLSMEELAKHCALSIRQMRQIEEGGDDAFYSLAIKSLAIRKVLAALQDIDRVSRAQIPIQSHKKPSVDENRVLNFRHKPLRSRDLLR